MKITSSVHNIRKLSKITDTKRKQISIRETEIFKRNRDFQEKQRFSREKEIFKRNRDFQEKQR